MGLSNCKRTKNQYYMVAELCVIFNVIIVTYEQILVFKKFWSTKLYSNSAHYLIIMVPSWWAIILNMIFEPIRLI